MVDVPAALHVSTGGEIRFSDGTLFSAIDTGASTLSIASPTDFGFLADHSAEIRIEGSSLNFAPDSLVSLSGGDIVIDRGTLINEGGEIRLTGVGAMDASVPINSGPAENASGNIEIDSALIDASDSGAGRITIRGGRTEIVDSRLFADNLGNDAPEENAGINLSVDTLFLRRLCSRLLLVLLKSL